MITKLKHHDKCDVKIVIGYNLHHYAHLECCDSNCKRKSRWIQWINYDDSKTLKKLGVPVYESSVVKVNGSLFDRKRVGL
jgi:hypothetical protein